MSISIENAVQTLKNCFPGIKGIRPGSELGYSEGSIFLGDCAEGGTIKSAPACDYYANDPEEKVYIFGVHKELSKVLDTCGFFVECHDPGTYIAYEA